jgi:hypothetical protein
MLGSCELEWIDKAHEYGNFLSLLCHMRLSAVKTQLSLYLLLAIISISDGYLSYFPVVSGLPGGN